MQQKQWHDRLHDGGQGGHIAISEKGWTDNEIGLEWFKQCFEPETRRCKVGKYRLLILDGHSSHVTSDAINFCVENDIILLCLPAHATDTLQPLDVGVFLPLSQAYRLGLEDFNRLGFGYTIDKVDFIDLYLAARTKGMTALNIISAWNKSGLVPFDPDIVLENIPDFEPEKEAESGENGEQSRLSTPPGLNLVSSNGESVFIAFTPSASGAHVDKIVKHVQENPSSENTKLALDALSSNLKSALADSSLSKAENLLAKETNVELARAAKKVAQKKTRQAHVNYGDARVLGQEVLDQRAQQRLDVIQEELWSEETKRMGKMGPDIYAHEEGDRRAKLVAKQVEDEKKYQWVEAWKELYKVSTFQLTAYQKKLTFKGQLAPRFMLKNTISHPIKRPPLPSVLPESVKPSLLVRLRLPPRNAPRKSQAGRLLRPSQMRY